MRAHPLESAVGRHGFDLGLIRGTRPERQPSGFESAARDVLLDSLGESSYSLLIGLIGEGALRDSREFSEAASKYLGTGSRSLSLAIARAARRDSASFPIHELRHDIRLGDLTKERKRSFQEEGGKGSI